MRDLTESERASLLHILKYSARLHKGYNVFQPQNKRYGTKKYKRSRVLMMLYLNKWLEPWEIVHHKDGDKTNDSIENLKVMNISDHTIKHYNKSNGKKPKSWKPANTLDEETINRIRELTEGLKKVNCSKVVRQLKEEGINISSVSVKKYMTKQK